ncbi:MAG: hypothetical protein AB1730_09135 [Myxococcota bacterium]
MTKRVLMLCTLLSASASRAAWPALSASVGYESQLYTSQRYDLVDADDFLPMLRVAAGTGFELGPGHLDVDVAFTTGASRESAHGGQAAADLWLRGVQVGGLYRYGLFSWLEPYARLGVGWDWATLQLTASTPLRQTVSHVSGLGVVGVQLPVRMGTASNKGRLPFMVFDLGGGYVVRPDYAFDALKADPVTKTEPVASGSVNLGSVPMHGGLLRVLVTVRW